MKSFILVAVTLLAASPAIANAQYNAGLRTVDLTNYSSAYQSPYTQAPWNQRAPVLPREVILTNYSNNLVPVPPTTFQGSVQAMPIRCESPVNTLPTVARYPGNPACQNRMVPVSYATPYAVPTVPVVAGVPQEKYHLGKGLLGQPKVYIDGEPVRNALRYLTF